MGNLHRLGNRNMYPRLMISELKWLLLTISMRSSLSDRKTFFGLKEEHVPVILINNEKEKFVKPNLEPKHIESWLKDYKDGKVAPFRVGEQLICHFWSKGSLFVRVIASNASWMIMFKIEQIDYFTTNFVSFFLKKAFFIVCFFKC
ncbi:protein disulfide-isomerase-like isoform X1 [Rutidosis leptorrhynchoides]|uniref:protein disulfide-isomerase-like isoform X1 n=1 Tax=Rutidosis leptorrhynchoides TaxID=125765 RepID=UPI003A99A79D